jgi:hypothetical protein
MWSPWFGAANGCAACDQLFDEPIDAGGDACVIETQLLRDEG